jgi:phage shock protein A
MGRIDRLRTVTMARIEAFLASLEKPEMVLPQLVKEMADTVAEATRAEAKALTAVTADRRRLDAASGRVDRLRKGAKLAVDAGEVETARQALAAQIQAEHDLEQCRARLATSEAAYQAARDVRQRICNQLEQLKSRKDEILARVRTLRQRESAHPRSRGSTQKRTRNILDLVSRMEVTVENEEARLEINDRIRQTLGATFQHERAVELENDAEVDRRLEELRREAEEETRT